MDAQPRQGRQVGGYIAECRNGSRCEAPERQNLAPARGMVVWCRCVGCPLQEPLAAPFATGGTPCEVGTNAMTKAATPPVGTDLAKPYEPKPREQAALAAYLDRRKKRPPAPRIKLMEKGGTVEVSTDHPMPSLGQALVMQALGTADADFFDGLLSQLISVGTQGKKLDEQGLNFMLATIKAIEPKDETETMLAAQMAAVHMATMTFARRLTHVDNIAQQDSAERAFNKLARTFAVQMEALKRYRTGGEQRVTVQHVTVNEGGQAIVGAVTPQPGGVGCDKKGEGQPCAPPTRLAHDVAAGPVVPTLRSTNPEREAVRVARDAERPL